MTAALAQVLLPPTPTHRGASTPQASPSPSAQAADYVIDTTHRNNTEWRPDREAWRRTVLDFSRTCGFERLRVLQTLNFRLTPQVVYPPLLVVYPLPPRRRPPSAKLPPDAAGARPARRSGGGTRAGAGGRPRLHHLDGAAEGARGPRRRRLRGGEGLRRAQHLRARPGALAVPGRRPRLRAEEHPRLRPARPAAERRRRRRFRTQDLWVA